MDAIPPPELANHEERITKLENAMTNLSCELKTLKVLALVALIARL